MAKDVNSNSKYILNSVDSALSILTLFFENDELSATDIAKEINIGRSTAFRILVTLENRGFLTKTEHSKYRLGIKTFALGQIAHSRMELVSLIHPYLVKMSTLTNETAHLTVMDGYSHILFVDKSIGNSLLKMDSALGLRFFAHHTGSGKAMLAFQTDQFIEQYMRLCKFEAKTPNSILTPEELIERLKNIRKQGYAEDKEESELGLSCISIPIIDASKYAIAAVSISGPATRIKLNKEHILMVLRDTVDSINSILD